MSHECISDPGSGMNHFEALLREKKDEPGALIPLLQAAQDEYGYIPEKAMLAINDATGVPLAQIYGVITFYAQFRLKPLGKHLIKICEGTACHVNGAKKILQALENELSITVNETTEDKIFSLQSVACLGCCSLSPAMMVGKMTHGSLTPDKIRKIIRSYREQ